MTTRLILMGFGTVGQGLADIIVEREALLKERGFDAKVVAIVDSKGAMISEDGTGINLKEALRKKRLEGSVAEERASPIEVLEQVDCDIVVDMTPTNIDTGEPGLSIMYRAFEMKRHVVTSNKGPLAIDFSGLSNAARDAGVLLRYEATVGGGMHLLSFIRDSLSSCKVFYIEGVLNGTCNYILSRMEETEYPYEEVLEEAKGLGIAEADPTYDVSGLDAACKLTIIANVVFGRNVTYSDVMTTGITEITPEALLLAADG
ncbi:MAG: homoserine dehydrogenase, partial [Methermicoccaceae archaeon]